MAKPEAPSQSHLKSKAQSQFMTTMTRIFNFSAGPAVLPVEVLEQAQRDLLSLPGVGMSILEISHRSKPFDEVIEGCETDLRALAGIPDGYHVLFLQGGASLQFSMVPMNLLLPGQTADYVVTGAWSQKAVKEAKRVGGVKVAATTEPHFTRVPAQRELTLDPNAAYVHYTTNNTIFGTEFHYVPDAGSVPLVADTSSDMFSRPIDVSKFALIYAGAQKNLAPAGLTLVILRDDMLGRTPSTLPTMLQYGVHVENKSMYNTPPVFAIYIMRLVLAWLVKQGGLAAIEKQNVRKADKLYAEIDRTEFYRGHAEKDSRSRMNVTFRLPAEELEKRFAKEATAAGLDGLKGHRSVGGMRASIYNAFPEAGVDALVQFMREFERKNG
jgi:phosphoserine aminotransferase